MSLRRAVIAPASALTLAGSAALAALAGCAGAPGGGGPVTSSSPPPVVLSVPDGDLELDAWSYCWSGPTSGACADGARPDDPASVGSPDAVDFTFARPGWEFQATFTERTDTTCPRSLTTHAVAVTSTTFHLEPVGEAGPWTVDLFGSGPEGDVATTFLWTTPALGPIETGVETALAVLANHDGAVDSYGVELFIGGLAVTPEEATAIVTVSNAVGDEVEIDLPPYTRGEYCPAGAVSFVASDTSGEAAIPLAHGGPVTYTVDLTIDGATYVGVGSWSLDLPAGANLHVPLEWTPELPPYVPGQAADDNT